MRGFQQNSKPSQKAKYAGSTRPVQALSAQSREENQNLHLQRTIGNQAVQRLLRDNRMGIEANYGASDLEANISSMRGGGNPLPKEIRRFFEPRFGSDFSHVRIHTGKKANQAALSINALAYTYGSNIVFGHGQYAPSTNQGKRLLAHELTHVRQQNSMVSNESVIRRYEAPEHQDIGDRYLQELLTFLQTDEGNAWASRIGMSRDELVIQIRNDPQLRGQQIVRSRTVDSETGQVETHRLTPGQIIALMGDLYETVDDLARAPETEVRSLIDIIEGERAGTIDNSSQRFQEATEARPVRDQYLELAKRNDTHFARQNTAEWLRLHQQALDVARQAAGENNQSLLQRALLIDAASGHFLTDSYAAGHMFDKGEVLAAITLRLQSSPVLANNPEMQTYIGIIGLAGELPQLALKNIHDRMNREGFIVRNAAGMHWRTFGDDHLARARETQRVAALAVFLSRQQVYQAFRGEDPSPVVVQSLLPNEDTVVRATYQALGYIPQAVRDIEQLIYANRALSPLVFGAFLGNIININISSIGYPGRERILADELERAREIGLSPTPSITMPILGGPEFNVGPSIFGPEEESGVIPGLIISGEF